MSSVRIISAALGAAMMLAAGSAASAAISAGDILPIAINTAGTPSDGFALVALNNIAAGDSFYFSDNELTTPTATAFNTGESYSKWVAPAGGIAAGTVINFTNIDVSPTFTVNLGTLSTVTFSGSANRGLSQTADALYFYLAAGDASVETPTTFLSYITIGNAADGAIPASLNANLAISLISAAGPNDSATYIGSRSSGSAFSDYIPLIDNIAANWTLVTGATPTANFDTTAFTIPAPGAAALMGIGGLLVARRRR
jgi:hypothetical protein